MRILGIDYGEKRIGLAISDPLGPKSMNNTIGKKAEEVLGFVEILKSHLNLPVTTVDERLTTVRAYKAMSDTKMSLRKKQKRVDMISAQFILQSYLDRSG